MEQEKTKKSKKKKYFYIALIVFVIILVIFISRGKNKEEYKFVLAENGDLIQEVDVVGRVEPVESVDLSFEKSGRIVEVLVGINDRVESGQILVSLDSHDLDAQLNQAQASLESARASLKQYQAALVEKFCPEQGRYGWD